MNNLILVSLLVSISFSLYGQSHCNTVDEDFQGYDESLKVQEQQPNQWMLMRPSAQDADIFDADGASNLSMNIPSHSEDFDTTDRLQIMQLVDIKDAQRISYKVDYYNECGKIAIDFISEFKDSQDYKTVASFEIHRDRFFLNGERSFFCYQRINDFKTIHIVLDYEIQVASLICDDSTTIVYANFKDSSQDLFGVAYGSNQCAFLDNICLNDSNKMTTNTKNTEFGNLEVYPIPLGNQLNLKMANLSDYQVTIKNINGKIFQTFSPEADFHSVPMADRPESLFLMEIKHKVSGSRKVVKLF